MLPWFCENAMLPVTPHINTAMHNRVTLIVRFLLFKVERPGLAGAHSGDHSSCRR